MCVWLFFLTCEDYGEGTTTIHFSRGFFFFLKYRSASAHQFHSFRPSGDQSTLAQRAETAVSYRKRKKQQQHLRSGTSNCYREMRDEGISPLRLSDLRRLCRTARGGGEGRGDLRSGTSDSYRSVGYTTTLLLLRLENGRLMDGVGD